MTMETERNTFFLPETLDEALKLKASFGSRGAFVAGGTDFVLKFRRGDFEPEAVIQLPVERGTPVLEQDGALRVSALVPLVSLVKDPVLRNRLPLLTTALEKIGSPQIRNISTLGGNLVNACPACDSAPPLMVYDAEVVVCSSTGSRRIPVEHFFEGPGATSIADDEALVAVLVPIPFAGELVRFRKFGPRGSNVIASANLAVRVGLNEDAIESIALAAGSIAPIPVRLRRIEALITGMKASDVSGEGVRAQIMSLLDQEIAPISDVRGSAWYKRRVLELSIDHLLEELAERG